MCEWERSPYLEIFENKYHLPHLQNFALHFVVQISLPLFASTVGGCGGCPYFSRDLLLVIRFLFSPY